MTLRCSAPSLTAATIASFCRRCWRRPGRRGHRHPSAGVVRRAGYHAARCGSGGSHRSRAPPRTISSRRRGVLRSAADGHRFVPIRSAASRAATCRASSLFAICRTSTPCWPRPRAARHAVVIGGGLLGLEAANGLLQRGMDVTVVHIRPAFDGAAARCAGGAAASRRARTTRPANSGWRAETSHLSRRDSCQRRAACATAASCRGSGGHGSRGATEYRACQARRVFPATAACWSTIRC